MSEKKITGSQVILDSLSETGAPDWAFNAVNANLESPATKGELCDLLHEQMLLNIQIAKTLSSLLADERAVAVENLGEVIKLLQSQVASFAGIAARMTRPDGRDLA